MRATRARETERALERLGAADPANRDALRRVLGPSELDAAFSRVLALAERDEATPSLGEIKAGPSLRRRLAVAAALVAATAVALVLAFSPGGPGGGTSVARALFAAAQVAQKQPYPLARGQSAEQRSVVWRPVVPGPVLGPPGHRREVSGGAVSYRRNVILDAQGVGDVHFTHQTAAGAPTVTLRRCTPGGLVLDRVVDGPAGFACAAPIAPPILSPELGRGPWDLPGTTGRADNLSPDPPKVRQVLDHLAHFTYLHSYAHPHHPFGTQAAPSSEVRAAARFNAVALLLSNPLVRPAVRATIFRLAAKIRGVSLNEDASDPLGRRGTELSIIEGPHSGPREHTRIRRELIFNPRTSAILAVRVVLLSSDLAELRRWLGRAGAPQVVEYQAFFRPRIVNHEAGQTYYEIHTHHGLVRVHISSAGFPKSEVKACRHRSANRARPLVCEAAVANAEGKLGPGTYSKAALIRALRRAGFRR